MHAASSAPGQGERVSRRDAAFAVAAGFLGWTLDAFDFFLVVIALPSIAEEFQVAEAAIAASLTLTLAFRPVGALLFGMMADRYGRRLPMIVDLVFFSVVEVATAFAPDLTTFLVLRALFGIGMGGEWGVGASLVMETVPPRWRGLISGFLQQGYAVGLLLAAFAGYVMLEPFGWRPLFFLGGAPALLALFVRFGVRESAVWEQTKAESWAHWARSLASHWKRWLYLTVLMAMLNFASHGTQDIFPAFLKGFRGMSDRGYAEVVIIMAIGAILGGMAFALASDRLGRRWMMIASFLGALAVVPLWAGSSSREVITLGAFLMQFMVQGAWGVIPAHINELSPDQVRGFLPGFSYQCGNLIAAPISTVQAVLAEYYDYSHVMASSAAIVFVGAILVTAVGPENRGQAFGKSP
jgi:SHS family lactate transporter-like MFS transporter